MPNGVGMLWNETIFKQIALSLKKIEQTGMIPKKTSF